MSIRALPRARRKNESTTLFLHSFLCHRLLGPLLDGVPGRSGRAAKIAFRQKDPGFVDRKHGLLSPLQWKARWIAPGLQDSLQDHGDSIHHLLSLRTVTPVQLYDELSHRGRHIFQVHQISSPFPTARRFKPSYFASPDSEPSEGKHITIGMEPAAMVTADLDF